MKKVITGLVLGMAMLSFGAAEKAVVEDSKPQERYAVILQAGAETNEGMARAVHALLYSKELLEAGYEVVLIFDGAGTGWARELQDPSHKLHPHYRTVKTLGVVEEICDYCAEAFDVKNSLSEQQQAFLTADYEGHPSIVKWIGKGYQVLVL